MDTIVNYLFFLLIQHPNSVPIRGPQEYVTTVLVEEKGMFAVHLCVLSSAHAGDCVWVFFFYIYTCISVFWYIFVLYKRLQGVYWNRSLMFGLPRIFRMFNFDSSLTLTSWNVRGLCNLTKLKQVMNRVNYLHPKILFLQETHLLSGEIIKLRRRWPGQVIAASYTVARTQEG